jgi:hypothetical protein
MDRIFKSLENLNVSEECFDDIMNMVEEMLSENIRDAIITKHGEPTYTSRGQYPKNKSAKLIYKAAQAREDDIKNTVKGKWGSPYRNLTNDEWDNYFKLERKRYTMRSFDKLGKGMDPNKNQYAGDKSVEEYNPSHKYNPGALYNKNRKPKSVQQRIEDSITRHNLKHRNK